MNVTGTKQRAGRATSERTKRPGAGNVPGGNLFTPEPNTTRNSGKRGEKKGKFVWKAEGGKTERKRSPAAGSRASRFVAQGNDTASLTAEAVGIALSQAQGNCDGLRAIIDAGKEDKESDAALEKVREFETAQLLKEKEEEEKKAQLVKEEEERKRNVPKGFSFSTRGPTRIIAPIMIVLLIVRWYVNNPFCSILCDAAIVCCIFSLNHNRLHTYKFVDWLKEPQTDGRPDHHKLKDFTRKCEYALWSHEVKYHWENKYTNEINVVWQLLYKDWLVYYGCQFWSYIASNVMAWLTKAICERFIDIPIIMMYFRFRELKAKYEWLWSHRVGGWVAYLVLLSQLTLFNFYVGYKCPDCPIIRCVSIVLSVLGLSWFIYFSKLLAIGHRVFTRVRSLHVSHGAYKQVTVFKNIDRSEPFLVAKERIKNSVKSLCSVNFDSSEILQNIDVLGDTCDLALGFFQSHAQELEDFLLPQQ